MPLLRALPDIDVPSAKSERFRHRLLLVLQGRARQIEVHPVLAGLLVLAQEKSDPEPGVIARQERDAVVVAVVGRLPAQDAAQKRARRNGSLASKQSATRSHVMGFSDPLAHSQGPSPALGENNARTLEDCDATRLSRSQHS